MKGKLCYKNDVHVQQDLLDIVRYAIKKKLEQYDGKDRKKYEDWII